VATNGSHAQSCTVAQKRNKLLRWTIIYSKCSTSKIKQLQKLNISNSKRKEKNQITKQEQTKINCNKAI
jgi:hypothetical protein